MAKARHTFVCRQCGAMQHRWMGKCPDCGEWDALEEQVLDHSADADPQRGLGSSTGSLLQAPVAAPISEVSESGHAEQRLSCNISELDRVLGGGIVPGSAILVGGDPGIGKSTLLLQACGALAARGCRTLYVTSEESAAQVRLRASRLGLNESDQLYVLADTNLARIVEQARKVQPDLLVIDSIQMIYKSDLDASPGSITQLRRCCTDLVYLAKATGMATALVGHVTKEGQLAGPRLLEHLVDVVLYFEGDRYHAHRIVRCIKNRFGATHEIGLFEMTGGGLREIPEGMSIAAAAGGAGPRPGSVICPAMTGSRCVLVEMQALTANGFPGSVKRKSSGLDANRLAMIIAVLEQHAELRLYDRDVFASVVGGLRIVEPASDLAMAMAIAGAHMRRSLPPLCAAVGELGLGGEIRQVGQLEQRVREAARLGYKHVIAPQTPGLSVPKGITLHPHADINRALQAFTD